MFLGTNFGRWSAALVVTGLAGVAGGQSILRVDPSRLSDGDGTTWATPCNNLESALARASYGAQIWLAAGTYRPAVPEPPADPRSATFTLSRAIVLYGGFPPDGGDGTFAARDSSRYESALSGDLLGNDTADVSTMADNCWHVLTLQNYPGGADGITVRSGNAPDSDTDGGGGVIGGFSGVFRHCLFTFNRGHGGGACRVNGGGAHFVDCRFEKNWSKWGSCISTYYGTATILNCEFTDNEADRDAACLQFGYGGQTVANCTFWNNRANAGTVILAYYSQVNMVNCTAINNTAISNLGSNVWLRIQSQMTVANCILWNYVNTVPAIHVEDGNILTIHHTDIKGGQAGIETLTGATTNWLTGNLNVDPSLVALGSGDFRLSANSPCLDAGDPGALPEDSLDLDGDGDLYEQIMVDKAGNPREALGTATATIRIVDLGAYEFQGDCNGNGLLDRLDIANGTSLDCDHNGTPDECQLDTDADGHIDACDNCPTQANANQLNSDADALGDACDNCPQTTNQGQENLDGDGLGDACDPDIDNDGRLNTADNCPRVINPGQEDADADGAGDACDLCPDTIPGSTIDALGCPPDFLGDMDRDGDVDQSDFGAFQICLSGSGYPQTDPTCVRAMLDPVDTDVDGNDLTIFRRCLSGTDEPADASCIRGG